MATIGLRELRRDASELVRRAEAGEEFSIAVAGRPTARLVAAGPSPWRTFDAVADLFTGPADPAWDADREVDNQAVLDTGTEQ